MILVLEREKSAYFLVFGGGDFEGRGDTVEVVVEREGQFFFHLFR